MSIVKNESGVAHLAVLAVLVAGLAGGTGYMVYNSQHKKTSVQNSESSVAEKSTLVAALPSDLLTVDKVKELSTAQKPSSSILAVQLENEEGALVYKVKLADGTVLVFNAQSGAPVANAKVIEFESQTILPIGQTAAIDFAKARTVALTQHGGTVQKMELENEEGMLVYSVRFTDGARVDINAADGTIVKTKPAQASNGTPPNTKSNDDSLKSSPKPSNNPPKSNAAGKSTGVTSSDSHKSSDDTATHDTNDTSAETETHQSGGGDDSSHGGDSGGGSGRGSSH